MNVLFITLDNITSNASISIANKAFLKGFIENGCQVTLVSPIQNGNELFQSFSNESQLHIINLNDVEEPLQGAKSRIPLWIRRIVGGFVRDCTVYGNKKSFTDKIDGLNIPEYFDLVFSSSDPKTTHIFTAELIKKKKIKYAYYHQFWSDPFADDISRKYLFLVGKKVIAEEHRLLMQSDVNLYISDYIINSRKKLYPDTSERYAKLYIPYLRISDSSVFHDRSNIQVAFLGDYRHQIRNIVPLYKAFKHCTYHLTICGGTDLHLKNTDNIKIYRRLPYNDAIKMENEADILVSISNRAGYQLPGKVFQYLATDKPVLFILDGGAENFQKEFAGIRKFVFCENNIDSIQKGLETAVDMIGKCHAEEQFCPKNIIGGYLDSCKGKLTNGVGYKGDKQQ